MNEPEYIIDELGLHIVSTHCNIIPFTDVRMFGIKFRLPKDIFKWTAEEKSHWVDKQCESFRKQVIITIASLDPNGERRK